MLPPELKQKIWQAIDTGIDMDDPAREDIFEAFAALLVRENRVLRQKVLKLGRDFAVIASDQNAGDGANLAGSAGKEACKYITDKIIKSRVYNKKKFEKPDIDRLIQDFYEEDDDF